MDWQRFLDENNIHYVTRGPNTKRGEASIRCPMCGEEDPSEHLGINLTNGYWGCHRDQTHRGKSPKTLVKAILGCSSTQAGLIVKQYNKADPDTLDGALLTLEADQNGTIDHEEDLAKQAKHQALGPQFKDFYKIKPRGISKRFFDYLVRRGFDDPYYLIEHYDLRCAMTGRYKDRIIIPVRLNGELLGWTSRAIAPVKTAPRYLASSGDVKTTVFNYDELKKGGERLFIVEGPFDAIRVDSYKGEDETYQTHGVRTDPRALYNFRATCTFGTSVTISQIALLRSLVGRFEQSFVLFDQGADGPAAELAQWVGAKQAYLPDNCKDPGELTDNDLSRMADPGFNGGIRNYYRFTQGVIFPKVISSPVKRLSNKRP